MTIKNRLSGWITAAMALGAGVFTWSDDTEGH